VALQPRVFSADWSHHLCAYLCIVVSVLSMVMPILKLPLAFMEVQIFPVRGSVYYALWPPLMYTVFCAYRQCIEMLKRPNFI